MTQRTSTIRRSLHIGAAILLCTAGIVQAQVNDAPILILPTPLTVTEPQDSVPVGMSLVDVDAGAGNMTLSVNVSDAGGVFTPAQVGTITWTFGIGVVSDTANATLAQLQTALANMVFVPAPGFAGTAAIQMSVNDNGNTGIGGAKSDTKQFGLKVCTAAEIGNPTACANNAAPVNHAPSPAPDTQPQTSVALPWSVTDVDVGDGTMQMEINVADHGNVLTPAETGTISWTFGNNVTSDVVETTQPAVNNALAGLTFRPANGFAGQARVVFEIDDRKNSGIGDVNPLADTDFIVIDVCTPEEMGTAACATNNAPVNHAPSPAPDTQPQTAVALPWSVTDSDVGPGTMQMEINVADHANVLLPAQVGTISWTFGTGVTSDVVETTMSALNSALAGLTFRPVNGFAGRARVVFEIDDRKNSGVGDVDPLADTDFIIVDVCTAAELGTADCAVNNAPSLVLPAGTWTTPSETPLATPLSVTDADVGPGQMQMELNLADANGVLLPAQVGSFTWAVGTGVTNDSIITTRAAVNTLLAGLVFTPNPTFVGTARLVMEIDDRGNSGTGGELAHTNFKDITVTPRAGLLGFESQCVRRVGEGVVLNLPISRSDGDDGAASVTVAPQNGSAVSGSDFTMTSATVLNWADQNRTNRTASFVIQNDPSVEGVETFNVSLQSAQGATLGETATVTVRIEPALLGDLVLSQDSFEEPSCP